MLAQKNSAGTKRDIQIRQYLMERSFARGSRYGLKRARWRRLWRVQIQEYLTKTIKNVMVLLGYIKEPVAAKGLSAKSPYAAGLIANLKSRFFHVFRELTIMSRLPIYLLL